MEELYTEFAYDDAFRTMVVKCDDLLLPFLNYTFGEHYDNTARIIRGCNEHLIDRGIQANEKESLMLLSRLVWMELLRNIILNVNHHQMMELF